MRSKGYLVSLLLLVISFKRREKRPRREGTQKAQASQKVCSAWLSIESTLHASRRLSAHKKDQEDFKSKLMVVDKAQP